MHYEVRNEHTITKVFTLIKQLPVLFSFSKRSLRLLCVAFSHQKLLNELAFLLELLMKANFYPFVYLYIYSSPNLTSLFYFLRESFSRGFFLARKPDLKPRDQRVRIMRIWFRFYRYEKRNLWAVILRNIFLIYFNCKYSRNKYISFYKLMNSIEI